MERRTALAAVFAIIGQQVAKPSDTASVNFTAVFPKPDPVLRIMFTDGTDAVELTHKNRHVVVSLDELFEALR